MNTIDIIETLMSQGNRVASNMRGAGYGPGGGIPDFTIERTLEYIAAERIREIVVEHRIMRENFQAAIDKNLIEDATTWQVWLRRIPKR